MFFLTMKKVAYILENDRIVIPVLSIPTTSNVISIPTTSNSDGKTTTNTDASDPTRKAEFERLIAENIILLRMFGILLERLS